MVTRSFLLLVARLVFFVHYHDAEILQGSEYGGASTQRDLRFATTDPPPGLVTFSLCQAAVQDSDFLSEAREKLRFDCWSQSNFRNQHQSGAAKLEATSDESEVDFCFTAAGDPVQQGHAELAAPKAGSQFITNGSLRRSEQGGHAYGNGLLGGSRERRASLVDLDQACVRQVSQM